MTLNPQISLVWMTYGDNIAVGIKHSGNENKSKQQEEIEQIYNFFYNFGLTSGALHDMSDGKFCYFCIAQENIDKIGEFDTPLSKSIKILVEDAVEEIFLKNV